MEIVPDLRRNPLQLWRRMTMECGRVSPKVCWLRYMVHVCVCLCAHTDLQCLVRHMCYPDLYRPVYLLQEP